MKVGASPKEAILEGTINVGLQEMPAFATSVAGKMGTTDETAQTHQILIWSIST